MTLAAEPQPLTPYDMPGEPHPLGAIDQAIFARCRQLHITPAHPCTDALFLRRAYLDLIGTLPTPVEARAFLADSSPTRRAKLVDQLLAREEYTDYWAMKWCDTLRVKSEFPINLWPNAVQAYHRWIRAAIASNMPLDRMARALLTASGSNFRDPASNFWRAMQNRTPEGMASTVALTFMGMRADRWPRARLQAMARLFAQVGCKHTGEWKEEIIFFDATRPAAAAPQFPDGTPARLTPGRDPRMAFADWLLAPGNPAFARAMANRLWSRMMGRGVIDEPDDLRPDNPPSNRALMAALEKLLVSCRYDQRAFLRAIANSAAYQLSPVPRGNPPAAEAAFAAYPVRRMDAEVLIDALDQLSGGTESYSSLIPEPYTFVPEERRTIQLADGSITSSFLELFGRPARDSGLEAERNNRPNAAQRLHMLNSSHVQRKLDRIVQAALAGRFGQAPAGALDNLYLAFYSRYPTDAERAAIAAYAPGLSRSVVTDVVWALANSTEFLYRH